MLIHKTPMRGKGAGKKARAPGGAGGYVEVLLKLDWEDFRHLERDPQSRLVSADRARQIKEYNTAET